MVTFAGAALDLPFIVCCAIDMEEGEREISKMFAVTGKAHACVERCSSSRERRRAVINRERLARCKQERRASMLQDSKTRFNFHSTKNRFKVSQRQ